MSRLVIVSNRVPNPATRRASAGGLVVALEDVMHARQALWFGWSGTAIADDAEPGVHTETSEGVTYTTIDLPAAEQRGFYQGFANGVLWPLLHGQAERMAYRRADHEAYNSINRRFAAALAPLLRDGDLIWIHDYQLFPLGQMLRERGVPCRIGFFLHVPFPPPSIFMALPGADGMLASLAAYDLFGLQTAPDALHLNDLFAAHGIAARAHAFPIGIDPRSIATMARRAPRSAQWRKMQASLVGRDLILGVDRLDYTKGIPHRFRGYAQLLRRFPEHRGKVTMMQIAPVSRGEVSQYRALRRELDELVGRINGEHSDVDWTPLRYITRAVPRASLAGFFRMARVGLVTPLRDGMNLVAKEYVAAQDAEDPGVLVLSRFAGAAEELRDTLLVNPYDPDEIAEALHRALTMKQAERRAMWEPLFAALQANTAAIWAAGFLVALTRDQLSSADVIEADVEHAG